MNLLSTLANWTLVAFFITLLAALLLIGGFIANNFANRESNEMKRRLRK